MAVAAVVVGLPLAPVEHPSMAETVALAVWLARPPAVAVAETQLAAVVR